MFVESDSIDCINTECIIDWFDAVWLIAPKVTVGLTFALYSYASSYGFEECNTFASFPLFEKWSTVSRKDFVRYFHVCLHYRYMKVFPNEFMVSAIFCQITFLTTLFGKLSIICNTLNCLVFQISEHDIFRR